MPPHTGPDRCTQSTTSEWNYGKIKRRRPGKSPAERSESSLRSLLPWPKKRPVTLAIKYLGGAECWFSIRVRGREIKRPGYVQLIDLMEEIHQSNL